MYSTCLYCHSRLGSNEVIGPFPVGRRLAFDSERGRLWVVCPGCGRWNLSPLDTRWDAIEECERRFRGSPLRAYTDNIGLARIEGGLELVRVGRPLPPEFASWRFGGQIRRRWVRGLAARAGSSIVTNASIGVGAAALAVATATGLAIAAVPLLIMCDTIDEYFSYERVVGRIRVKRGAPRTVRLKHVGRMELLTRPRSLDWGLHVAHERGMDDLQGSAAVQSGSQLLAWINRRGAPPADIRRAVDLIADAGGPTKFVIRAKRVHEDRRRSAVVFNDHSVGALGLRPVEQLALEMAMNEDAERQAMQGELELLEQAWKDAEEIAAIADNLLLPSPVSDAIDRLRAPRVPEDERGGA
ncbi:MAG TPA: hypothetical protein VJ672_08730 [Gemmatimonadaceae bacterium]|nr:hypothetical protein [Gemmatimonadaceae bacterium]